MGGKEKRMKRQQEIPHNTHTDGRRSEAAFTCNNSWWHHHFFFQLTFGKSRMWFASNKSSSRLREYRRMSSGTLGSEQCRLSTNSTCRLHPLKIGMHLNIVEYFLIYTTKALATLFFYPAQFSIFTALIALLAPFRYFFFAFFYIFSHVLFVFRLQHVFTTPINTDKMF